MLGDISVCIAGWYGYQPFYRTMESLADSIPVHVVCHKDVDTILPKTILDNKGLEFGCYDFYVNRLWDRKRDVLFCHDDISISSPSVVTGLPAAEGCTFIFSSEDEVQNNGAKGFRRIGIHGRAMLVSEDALHKLGGFWYGDGGDINDGILAHYESLKKHGIPIHNLVVPGWVNGRRGVIPDVL